MSKKRFDEQNIINELTGNSAFFPSHPETPLSDDPIKDPATAPVIGPERLEEVKEDSLQVSEPLPPQTRSQTVTANKPRSEAGKEDATKTPRHRDTTVSPYSDTIIETIRKAVKQLGKEAATHRFTIEEKKMLRDIVYTYGAQGIKTSENEVARIAIHHLVNDYQENNETSVLARVLERLNS